jgi:hypothetical protein
MTMPVTVIFGSAKPDVQYSERRTAYVVITVTVRLQESNPGRKAAVRVQGSIFRNI